MKAFAQATRADLLDLSVGADDERQPIRELPHEGDLELGAVLFSHSGSDIRQERELEAVRLFEVQMLRVVSDT